MGMRLRFALYLPAEHRFFVLLLLSLPVKMRVSRFAVLAAIGLLAVVVSVSIQPVDALPLPHSSDVFFSLLKLNELCYLEFFG